MAQRSLTRHDPDTGLSTRAGDPPAGHASFEARWTGTEGEIALRGELDAYTAPKLDEALTDLGRTSTLSRIVVDLRELEFIDVTGLGALVSANNGAHRRGGELVLRSPSSQALKLLEITGLNQVFTVENA